MTCGRCKRRLIIACVSGFVGGGAIFGTGGYILGRHHGKKKGLDASCDEMIENLKETVDDIHDGKYVTNVVNVVDPSELTDDQDSYISFKQDEWFQQNMGEVDKDGDELVGPEEYTTWGKWLGNSDFVTEEGEEAGSDDAEDIEEQFEHYTEMVETVYTPDGDAVKVKHTEDGPEEITEPYIVSRDSFENEHMDFSKNCLTYYEGDDTLCDERDDVIVAINHLIGDEALTSFGEGSDDENIVFVRNIALSSDFEITRDDRSYVEVVLGVPSDESYSKARKFFKLDEDREE